MIPAAPDSAKVAPLGKRNAQAVELCSSSPATSSNPGCTGFHGGKGTRTPDIQLAKLALYQLSYAPSKLMG